jgi:hypothetical protein
MRWNGQTSMISMHAMNSLLQALVWGVVVSPLLPVQAAETLPLLLAESEQGEADVALYLVSEKLDGGARLLGWAGAAHTQRPPGCRRRRGSSPVSRRSRSTVNCGSGADNSNGLPASCVGRRRTTPSGGRCATWSSNCRRRPALSPARAGLARVDRWTRAALVASRRAMAVRQIVGHSTTSSINCFAQAARDSCCTVPMRSMSPVAALSCSS